MKTTKNDGKITASDHIILEDSFLRDRMFTKIWNERVAYENKYNEHPNFVKIPNDLYFAFSTEVFEHRGFPYDMAFGLHVCFTESIKTVEEIEVF